MNDTAMAVAEARRSNKTKWYSSQSAFSLITSGPPCWPGRKAKWVLSFFSMRWQAELIVTEQTRNEATPEKFQSTHNISHSLVIQIWKHPLCARHVPIHFKCSTHKSLVIKYGKVFHLGEPWQSLEKAHHIVKCQVNNMVDVKLCTSSDLRTW